MHPALAVSHSPPILRNEPTFCDKVTQIAVLCLKELGVSLLFHCPMMCFISTTVGFTLVYEAILIQAAISIVFYSLKNFSNTSSVRSTCEWATAMSFSYFSGLNLKSLIHELGHVLAVLSVYKTPGPHISVHPFFEGVTHYTKNSLTSFGKALGPVASSCFVVANGAAFTLLLSAVILSIGLALKKTHPLLSKYLISWSLLDFLHHLDYAYTATHFTKVNLRHDFSHLTAYGLSPQVAMIGIIAIPILIFLMDFFRSRTSASQ